MPTKRTAFGYTYYSYSLHDWRKLRSLDDIPRSHWSILQRPATNYQLANRLDHRDGAVPQLGGVDHIGAGFQDNNPIDLGAERLNEYGLNPNNTRASWNGAVDSNTITLLAPPDTRPWQHGVAGSPYDLNSYGIGVEDGILSTNWDALPEPKRTAHLRMRAAWWALFFGSLRWELKYTDTAAGVWDHIRRGKSWGLTQHGIVDWNNRTDAGLLWAGGGTKRNTFPYHTLLAMIREEMGLRTSGVTVTPGLPDPNEGFETGHVERIQRDLNDYWGTTLDVDGRLGPLTRAAVTAMQEDLDLDPDGLPGPITTTAMEDAMSKIDELLKKVDDVPQRVHTYRLGAPGSGDEKYAATFLRYAAHRSQVDALAAQVAGLNEALRTLAVGQGLDPDALEAAVRRGVDASLREAAARMAGDEDEVA